VRRGTPVVLATGNAGKVREFARLLAGTFDVRPLPAGIVLPPETGDTFAANARLKAESVFQAVGGDRAVLADDSGLEVGALGGRPGIFSARFAGENATDADNVAKLLRELSAASDRSARFVCALCLLVPAAEPRRVMEVQGVTNGSITPAPRGDDGFGYDPVFQPEGWDLTLAEASPEDKDRVSHRGAAARSLLDCLARGFEV
jgi:non-canonical purine NTP pyrophosphatase (RdgB/HAM1 family)